MQISGALRCLRWSQKIPKRETALTSLINTACDSQKKCLFLQPNPGVLAIELFKYNKIPRFPAVQIVLVLFVFLLTPETLYAQTILVQDTTPQSSRKVFQRTYGILLHSGGFAAQYRRFYKQTYYKRLGYEIMGSEMKTDKQIRSVNPLFNDSKSFVYGKLNTILIGRFGVGYQQVLTTKPYFGGVEISLYYTGGGSLAIAKPIYLYIANFTNQSTDYHLTSEQYDPEEHFSDNIYGRAPFFDGIENTSFYPGIYLHLGLNFEFGYINSKPKSLEAGAVLDLYPSGIPVMAYQDDHHYFLCLYFAFNFGKRF